MTSRRQIAELKQLALEERDREMEAALEELDRSVSALNDDEYAMYREVVGGGLAVERGASRPKKLTATKSSDKPIPDNRSCLKAPRRRPTHKR